MTPNFPSQEWIDGHRQVLNSDADYARIAHGWEGDLALILKPGGSLQQTMILYWDLWHGTCRDARIVDSLDTIHPAFTLTGNFEDIVQVLRGKLDPMQAMLIRKLQVRGSMPYMMRNVPTVLAFVRCARQATTEADLT